MTRSRSLAAQQALIDLLPAEFEVELKRHGAVETIVVSHPYRTCALSASGFEDDKLVLIDPPLPARYVSPDLAAKRILFATFEFDLNAMLLEYGFEQLQLADKDSMGPAGAFKHPLGPTVMLWQTDYHFIWVGNSGSHHATFTTPTELKRILDSVLPSLHAGA